MDRSELIIAALQQRIGELTSAYETQIAVLRAEITMFAKQVEEKQQAIEKYNEMFPDFKEYWEKFKNINLNLIDLNEINEYLYSQLKFNCTRTFHYTDILAATRNDKHIIDKVIENYKHIIFKN